MKQGFHIFNLFLSNFHFPKIKGAKKGWNQASVSPFVYFMQMFNQEVRTVRIHIAKHHNPRGQRAILVFDCLVFLKLTNISKYATRNITTSWIQNPTLNDYIGFYVAIKVVLFIVKEQSNTFMTVLGGTNV